jgi:MFS transporter, YNFM family, putative membrane transport protein
VKAAVAPLAQERPPTALDEVVAQLNDVYIEKGTPLFMRTVLALFSGGFATFALLYCVQPMMPVLSHEFSINAAQSSLILSVSTAMLAFGLLITGPISDRLGRKPVMVTCAVLRSRVHHRQRPDADLGRHPVDARAARSVPQRPGGRGHDLPQRRDPPAAHRPGHGPVHRRQRDWGHERAPDHWRIDRLCQLAHGNADHRRTGADCGDGVLEDPAAESRNFRASSLKPRSLINGFVMHFKDAGLPWLFLEAFVLMGAFVTLFNYIGYRLLADPYDLSQAVVGLLSVVYLSGIYSSAKIGSLADRLGRRRVLWATIVLMLAGIALTLFSPSATDHHRHADVHLRLLRRPLGSQQLDRPPRHCKAKGQASSLYLFSYYAGSSIAGTAGWVFLAFAGLERDWRVYRRAAGRGVAGGVEAGQVATAQTVGAGLPAMWPEESPQGSGMSSPASRLLQQSSANKKPA